VGHLYGEFERPQDVGSLIGAIDIASFVPLDRFYDNVALAVREIKSSRRAPWASEILVPGEPEARARTGAEAGWVAIPSAIRKELIQLGERLNVALEE
jgi:LDH2 family malate/lactate/ureidoglycolate dehydrogenase